jgi:hypothetical protein
MSGELDTSNCENFSYMFSFCDYLKTAPNLDTSNGTNFDYMFYSCPNLTEAPELDVSNGTSFSLMFGACDRFEVIPKLTTNLGTNFYNMVANCNNLVKITELSAESVKAELALVSIYANNVYTRYILIKDIGTVSTFYSANFKGFQNYGVEDAAFPLSAGARQSLIDTLITYSYDRATAGYDTCNVTLSTNTKALLTEDEIAQITAKGYTIA